MPRDQRRVKAMSRPTAIYGRPQPVRQRRNPPEIKLNLRAVAAVVIVIVAVVWWWRFFTVKQIVVTGSRNYSSSLVTAATQAEIKRHWWWHNLTLVNTSGLQKDLLSSQPQLADVAISRRWPGSLELKVTERNPNLAWLTGGNSYLLSQEGIIIASSNNSTVKLPVVVDTSNLPVRLGDKVAPAGFVQFCLDVIRLLPKQGLQVTKMQIPATTNEVYVTTNKNFYIKFDTTRLASDEVGDLTKVLTLLKTQNKQPAEYIDLRIDGSAYYK